MVHGAGKLHAEVKWLKRSDFSFAWMSACGHDDIEHSVYLQVLEKAITYVVSWLGEGGVEIDIQNLTLNS